VSDPILLFLILDAVALLGLGASTSRVPPSVCGFLTTILCGLGLLLCLPPLLMRMPSSTLAVPVGPPGLSLHFALDPLALFFLVIAFLAATAISAFHATPVQSAGSVRATAFCVGGVILSLLAADGVALVVGLAGSCAAIGIRRGTLPLAPILLLGAVCLLTPAGYAPRFDTIAAAPIDATHAATAAALTLGAAATLAWPTSAEDRCWFRDALIAGLLIPFGIYVLLRLTTELSGNAVPPWWGFVVLLVGGAAAVFQGWFAAGTRDIDIAAAALLRQRFGHAIATIGLALIARSADLPGAATFALEATCLTAIGAAAAGTLTTLCAHVIGSSAGTYRLSRLGGLAHTMPATSSALSAGLLAMAALPPSLGFAALWLSFQSILSAPRTGGLPVQLPLALIAAAIAVSAALGVAASVRIVGIAVLGRPRTPRGAGAAEGPSPIRIILLSLAGVSLTAGIVPGPLLWLLADPAIHALTGLPSTRGLGFLAISGSSPRYLALPVLALIGLAAWIPLRALRQARARGKVAGPWLQGMTPPVGLPFGNPAAQSAGAGFLPRLPTIPWPRLPVLPKPQIPSATAGIWLIVVGFAVLLLMLMGLQ
jgi:formate hydrogenlyase subunit 3/multisubunit Na+/H+ antiporter MnhD subunit